MSRFPRLLIAAALGLGAMIGLPAQARVAVDDPVYTQGLQWGLERIGAADAWSQATGRGVTIAIVDSGADLRHEDLQSKIIGSVSCIGANDDPSKCTGSAQDDNGHGTHVSGIAAAATNNRLGVAGVAPDAKLLEVRVLANDCSGGDGCTASGESGDVSAGIRWAVDHGARVINLSLGGGAAQSALGCSFCDAIDYAWGKGAIAVVAAGNDAVLPSGFGNQPAVVVTATTREDTRASYSNTSSSVVRTARWPVAAPGGEAETKASDCATDGTPKGVLSTYWIPGQTNQYACLAGTSMATPHVSGALALLLSTGLSPQAAIDRLLATAKDLGPAGRDDSFGYGRIDLAKAVGASPTTTTIRSTPSTTATSSTARHTSTTPGTAPGPSTTAGPLGTPVPAPPGAPTVSVPTVAAAVPLGTSSAEAKDLPVWLVVLAMAAIVVTSAGAAATGWRLARPDARR